jgi:hypothetical protein
MRENRPLERRNRNGVLLEQTEQPQKFASKNQVLSYVRLMKKRQFELNFWRNGIPADQLEGLKQHRSDAMLRSEF